MYIPNDEIQKFQILKLMGEKYTVTILRTFAQRIEIRITIEVVRIINNR